MKSDKIKIILLLTVGIIGCIPMPIYHSTSRTKKTSDVKSGEKTAVLKDTSIVVKAEAHTTGGVSKEQQDKMIQEINSWLGTPYQFGIFEKGKGTDCSGFVGYLFKNILDKKLPRQSSEMYGLGQAVSQDELQFGDLVFFQNTYKGASGASHVGMYTGNGRFAHASTTVGVTYSRLSEPYYAKHFLGCKRVIGN